MFCLLHHFVPLLCPQLVTATAKKIKSMELQIEAGSNLAAFWPFWEEAFPTNTPASTPKLLKTHCKKYSSRCDFTTRIGSTPVSEDLNVKFSWRECPQTPVDNTSYSFPHPPKFKNLDRSPWSLQTVRCMCVAYYLGYLQESVL